MNQARTEILLILKPEPLVRFPLHLREGDVLFVGDRDDGKLDMLPAICAQSLWIGDMDRLEALIRLLRERRHEPPDENDGYRLRTRRRLLDLV